MSAGCAHRRWVRRPDEDADVICRFRCADCDAPAWRRFNAPDARILPFPDREKPDEPTSSDIRIESRLLEDRIRGGAYIPLGECNGKALYHPRGASL